MKTNNFFDKIHEAEITLPCRIEFKNGTDIIITFPKEFSKEFKVSRFIFSGNL